MPIAHDRRRFLKTLVALAGLPVANAIAGRARSIAAENPRLRISAVEPVLLRGGKCFVIVRTTEGVTGIGEASPMNARVAAEMIRTSFAPLLLGANPLDIERLWEKVYYATYKQGVMGMQPEALAAVDIALWDILGKVTGLSISQLLGGRRRESVRMYSSIGGGARATPAEMARKAVEAVADGFTALKVRMDHGPVPPDADIPRDLDVLRTVRKAIGEGIEFLFDPNNGYSVQGAIRVGKEIAGLGVIHFEEPVAQTDYAGMARVVEAIDIPVAAGEHEYTRWQFRDLIERGGPDILQPDLVKCAGITEAVKIAALASTHHKKLVPHQTQPTIGQAASLHFVSVFASGDWAHEIDHGGMRSELHKLFKEPLRFEKGRIAVPVGPGLGLELEESKLKDMTI